MIPCYYNYYYYYYYFFFFFFFKLPTVLSSRGIYKIGGKEKCVFHRPSSVGQKLSNEPANEMALHLWTMTEMRWNRKAVSLGSPEDADKRRPKQAKNLSPSSLIGPKVSIATGQNKYVRTCHSSILRLSLMQPRPPSLSQPNASGLAYRARLRPKQDTSPPPNSPKCIRQGVHHQNAWDPLAP